MKRKLSKRFFVTLTAGVLATLMALGGTYAWFTSTATTEAELEAIAGTVKITATTPVVSEPQVFKFGDEGSGAPNAGIEAVFDTKDPGDPTNVAFLYDDREELDNAVKAAFNPTVQSKLVTDTSDFITPGSVLKYSFEYTNESNVYTYLRYKLNQGVVEILNGTIDNTHEWTYAVVSEVTVGTKATVSALSHGGYYYFADPIEPATPVQPGDPADPADVIKVEVYILLAGGRNVDNSVGDPATHTPIQLMANKLTIGSTGNDYGAELIQAANNAVFLYDDWKKANDYWLLTNPGDFFQP